jgi:hypothetical protein
MPVSHKHQVHSFHKHAHNPSRQRTSGRITFALLFGAFGLLIALFTAGSEVIVLLAGAVAGVLAGYYIGRQMEKQAQKK